MDVFSLPKDTRPRGWYLALMAPNVKGPTFAWLDPSRLYCNSQVFRRANDLDCLLTSADYSQCMQGAFALSAYLCFVLDAGPCRLYQRPPRSVPQ